MESNMVEWFEIPVTDMDRAKKFYDAVFKIDIQIHDFNGLLMGWFPSEKDKTGAMGSLVQQAEFYKPSATAGPILYFSCKDVQIQADRIKKAGGKLLQAKKLISEEVGYMALFIDSEGNRLALYSKK